MRLIVITATTNRSQADPCIDSWIVHSRGDITVVVADGKPYRGTVPTFRQAVDQELAHDGGAEDPAEIIAILHDDLEIDEDGWDEKVLLHFERHPNCGLLGFGGAMGLGASDMYLKPYDPMSLARIGFRSNLREAEKHGIRSLLPEKVACLDGFSQIGRRVFWLGQGLAPNLANARNPDVYGGLRQWERPWTALDDLGVTHHLYDSLLGAIAKRYGWETWYLPIRCHHYGGRTTVGDHGYQEWAKTQDPDGDHGFWVAAHEIGFQSFKDVLPLRV